jgi:ATP-dependent Clp protease adaptor protein ClpS
MSQSPLDRTTRPDDPSPRLQRRTLPMFKVFLCNDAAKELMYVVRTLMELMRFGRAEATHRMWEAHHRGRSLILTAHLERAELYVELFAERGLPASLEPV